jgi:hypothetical protein
MWRPSFRREVSVKMDITNVRHESVKWMELARDRVQWRGIVKMVMNLRVS